MMNHRELWTATGELAPASPHDGSASESESELQDRIVARLAHAGYIAEVTPEDYGGVSVATGKMTAGFGDLLVWADWWFHLVTMPAPSGFKRNLEVKRPAGRLSVAQRDSHKMGGLVIVRSPEEAIEEMRIADRFIAGAIGLTTDQLIAAQKNAVGRIGVLEKRREQVVVERYRRRAEVIRKSAPGQFRR